MLRRGGLPGSSEKPRGVDAKSHHRFVALRRVRDTASWPKLALARPARHNR
jgi:hypothetical protein